MFNKEYIENLVENAKSMQNSLEKAQDELAKQEIEGADNSRLIKIVMNCKHNIRKVSISPTIINNKDLLEKTFLNAVNATTKMVESYTANEMLDKLSSNILTGLDKINPTVAKSSE